MSRGVEKLIHTCRSAHESRWLVGRNDFANGFNSMDRQKMLDAHCQYFPEGTEVFNFFYGSDSPVFMFEGNDVVLIKSSKGPRQGCSAGTHGFCLGLNPLMIELKALYPEFEIRALTDDVIPIVPLPPSDSEEDWQRLYMRYADFMDDLTRLSFVLLGLTLNPGKGGLLLPPGAPEPSADVYARFPASFDFQREGFRVAGSPIGSDSFMTQFVNGKLKEAHTKVACIKLVGEKSPRAAHRLLICCASKLMSFLASTVPPHIMAPALRAFDNLIESAFFEILSPSAIQCSQDRMHRATLKVHLPSPVGCGLVKASEQGAFAWWASVSASLNDNLLYSLRSGQARFCKFAWAGMVSALGGERGKLWTQVKHMLPEGPTGLVDGSRYSPVNKLKSNVCNVAIRLLTTHRIERFRSLASPALIISDGLLTAADVAQVSSRSYAGRIFASSLKEEGPAAFSPAAYVAWALFFLSLPPTPTLHNHEIQPGFDYPVQRCMDKHGIHVSPFIDSGGCHASSGCPSTATSRSNKHTYISRVVVQAAMDAGLSVRVEPDTHSLLLGEFTKADCRRIFPKAASKQYMDKFKAVLNALEVVSAPSCTISEAEKTAYVQVRIDQLPVLGQNDVKGLRIDAALENTI